MLSTLMHQEIIDFKIGVPHWSNTNTKLYTFNTGFIHTRARIVANINVNTNFL